MKNRKFYTVLGLVVLIILLGSRIYFGITNFNLRQKYLQANYEYGDLVSYLADSQELVGLDVRNAKANAPLLTSGMSVSDIATIDLQPGLHSLVNVGLDEAKLQINGEAITILPDSTLDFYLDENSTISIEQGSVFIL